MIHITVDNGPAHNYLIFCVQTTMTTAIVKVLLLSSLLLVSEGKAGTCKVDVDGNCLDQSCENKYPDCEKRAKDGTICFHRLLFALCAPSSPLFSLFRRLPEQESKGYEVYGQFLQEGM